MKPIRLLHIIPHLSRGGASRTLLATAHYLQTPDLYQQVLSLVPPDAETCLRAANSGVEVISRHPLHAVPLMAAADLVQIHFWNTPALYALLGSDLPAMRLAIWFKIAGHRAPQVISREVVSLADRALVSSTFSLALPACQSPPPHTQVSWMFSSPDFQRLHPCQPQSHSAFTVGYLGTVDFVKMHRDFISLCTQINIPSAQFLVAGGGNAYPILQQQIQSSDQEGRFELLGYVEDVSSFFSRLDVFGYPLCPDNYATSELVLQEAMYAGIPPVILAYGGAQATVIPNQTGLITSTPTDYCRAIEYLYRHPEERLRLGCQARAYAQRYFGAQRTAERFQMLYDELLTIPKSTKVLSRWRPNMTGCERFLFSLGEEALHFVQSYSATNLNTLWQADSQIAAATPVLCNPGAGGILHYRKVYPEDPYLRFWSGLILLKQGKYIYSIGEFQKAIQLGFHHWRIHYYMAHSASRVKATALVQASLNMVRQKAPELGDLEALLVDPPYNLSNSTTDDERIASG